MTDTVCKDEWGEDCPELNLELLRDLVGWARQDDERFQSWGKWHQESWAVEARNGVCQTAYCIAGQAAVQAGYQITFDHVAGTRDWVSIEDAGFDPDEVHEVRQTSVCLDPVTNAHRSIEFVAQQAIGLTYAEAEQLFHYKNTIRDVERIATQIAERRGLTL